MPRTVNPALRTVRREAFVDAAQRLIQCRGYEAMSIQEVLDAVGASRGAFYHYFDSKQALLEAVIDRITDQAIASLEPIVGDSTLPALRALERIFTGIAGWKAQRKDLMLAIIAVWRSDSNAIVREKLRHTAVHRLVSLLAPIIQRGVAEGLFSVHEPTETAAVLVYLL